MTEINILTVLRETLLLALTLSLPVLIVGALTGVLISIIQTATSIQEQSLSFIPKLLVTLLSLALLSPWMLSMLMTFTIRLFRALPAFGR